jgi:hypothetical protein
VDDPLRNKLLALLSIEDLNSLTGASSLVVLAQGDVVQKEGGQNHDDLLPAIGPAFAFGVLKGGRTLETCVVAPIRTKGNAPAWKVALSQPSRKPMPRYRAWRHNRQIV